MLDLHSTFVVSLSVVQQISQGLYYSTICSTEYAILQAHEPSSFFHISPSAFMYDEMTDDVMSEKKFSLYSILNIQKKKKLSNGNLHFLSIFITEFITISPLNRSMYGCVPKTFYSG
jgi:hypothetical protein